MRHRILKGYSKTINDIFKGKEELIKFLINHERKNVLIDNLEREIKKADLTFPLKSDHVDLIIKDCTIQFCRAALTTKEKEVMSSNAKHELDKKVDGHLEIIEKLDTVDMADQTEYIPPKKILK